MVLGHPLVEQARATLCRLADAPPAAEAAAAASAEIESAWSRPLVAGIGGDVQARTELFNAICDAKALDPFARAPGSAAVRIKRGPATGFRATRDDGTVEEHALPPDRTKDLAAARARADGARGELHEREHALARVESALPKRPPWWALWLWLAYWIGMWRFRRKRAEQTLAQLACDEARQKATAVEQDAAALEAHARLAKQRYYEGLKNLASGGAIGSGVLEVEITLAGGPLPEGIEIIELAGASRAAAEVDAVLLVQGEHVFAPAPSPIAIGDHVATLAVLPQFLADARALRIARFVQTKVKQAMSSLAEAIERKEATFRARIERLQALRIHDPEEHARAQLQKVRGEISASVNAVVEHSSVHLGSELAQLQQEWIGAIAGATDVGTLKAALAKIEEEWEARPRRIADEVRVLVMGGLGGSARDLYPTIVAELVPLGLPEEHARPLRMAPELPPVVLLPSLAKEATKLEKPGFLSGLFRSWETRRGEVRERVYQRLERMRELAEAELLDAEPRLHHAIVTALATMLEGAIAKQQAWLDAALDAERDQISEERKTIAPLVDVHDAVRTDVARLAQMIARVELDQPAITTAAAAAQTASLSR